MITVRLKKKPYKVTQERCKSTRMRFRTSTKRREKCKKEMQTTKDLSIQFSSVTNSSSFIFYRNDNVMYNLSLPRQTLPRSPSIICPYNRSGLVQRKTDRGGGGSAEEQWKFYVTFVGPIWLKFEVCMVVVRCVCVRGGGGQYAIIHPDCSTL